MSAHFLYFHLANFSQCNARKKWSTAYNVFCIIRHFCMSYQKYKSLLFIRTFNSSDGGFIEEIGIPDELSDD